MISYVILHYNRPYLLDINIRLLRKYAPKNTQIIVADDGSESDVVKRIKSFDIDDIVVQTKNVNNPKVGTCSETIRMARDKCKNEFYMFSEDDYWYSPDIVDPSQDDNDRVFPDVKYPSEVKFSLFEETIDLFKNNSKIIHAQLAINDRQVPVNGTVSTKNVLWSYRENNISYYYSNCPAMMRLDDFKQIEIPNMIAIWKVENIFATNINKIFGHRNWAVVPQFRYYIHTGYPFSQRPVVKDNTRTSLRRMSVSTNIQNKFLKRIHGENLSSFGQFMSRSYIRGYFNIDFDEVIKEGTEQAFTSAFNRLFKKQKEGR